MNKETFFTMPYEKRAEEVNKLLQSSSLKEVAEKLGISYSTFTKEMQAGDYVFIQRDNRYYKFIRDPNDKPSNTSHNIEYSNELTFVRDNLDTLKKLIETNTNRPPLILEKTIYSKNSSYSVKSIKMNDDIYSSFSKFCNDNYPHFRVQDLIAQSLLEFMNRY